jgi:tRNA A37 threonylcarbamoyladenosine synthetase subunit TsaC/SUA5/YrdC
METIIKIKNSAEGKKLIAHLQSLSYVKVLGDSSNLVDVKELKSKVKKAESSKSLTLEEAIARSAAWKSKYK